MNQIYGNQQRLSVLAALASVAQIILLATAWLLPLVSEYRLMGDNISELVLGRYGFIQTAAFLIAGFGTLGLAFVVRKLTIGSWGSLIGSLLLAINGAGTFLVAFFPTDRIDSPADLESLSTTGMIHITLALASFVCIIAGMFVLTWTFKRRAEWRSLTLWSALFAASALSLFFAQTQGPLVGLMQRLLVTTIVVWLVLVAFGARSIIALRSNDHATFKAKS